MANKKNGSFPKEVTVNVEKSKVVTNNSTHTLKLPAFVIDQYGYYLACLDGATTIRIGPNGVQTGPEGTHSIQTLQYVCSEFVDEKSKKISRAQFQEALYSTGKYIDSLMQIMHTL